MIQGGATMRVGIMQPYFLPYIGYWQLLNAVDQYVLYDDVNYINRGWINRNRILLNGAPAYLTVPLHGASQNKKINEIEISSDEKSRAKNLRTVELAYKKAPFFEQVFPLYQEIIQNPEPNLAVYLEFSIRKVCRHLGIQTKLLSSSSLPKDNTLKGQDKILSICKLLAADDYYNAIGGQTLYDASVFAAQGIHLHFLQTDPIEYKQFDPAFSPNLSILDVMMFNSQDEIQTMLRSFTLL